MVFLLDWVKKVKTIMRKRSTVYDCAIIQLPRIFDDRGNLTVLEECRHIPFRIARTYWIYDVPGGESRGEHAFRRVKECVVALSGSFEVFLDDGIAQRIVTLTRAYNGLYIPNMVWRRFQNFSTNSVAVVVASESYSKRGYIRDYSAFEKLNTRSS